ncbi:MAG: tol-pal system protein YbgF [Rhodospirillaceae bacterium]|nr:tol-pal system protein YbgF [Rhodospirillaceae bacterium]MYF85826.1 tol-pal system protein YbgF [Rhodospirillaceae bacterium]MYH38273.1 tol-pal system protein YbgF [Rhodospirillaceae bacterium]MYK14384.1 tol-pal system protein YbgF [Rhodospirillaceae bacterium]
MTVRQGACRAAIAILVGLGSAAGPSLPAAQAQVSRADVDDLRFRLRRLERDFNALRGGDRDIPSSLATRFQNRLNQMERTIQSLTDRVEDLIHRVEKLEKDRKTFETDTEFRLGRLEKRGGVKAGARGAKPPPGDAAGLKQDSAGQDSAGQDGAGPDSAGKEPATASASSILPPGTEIEQYRFAISELRQARYDRAAEAFQEFLRRHPKGRFAGNAYYWLGETYYAQQNYRLAAIRFADGFKKFPKHPKAPDNLLKLGMSMAHLKKTKEACASWAELKRRYPSAPSYVKRKAAQERKKLGCRV